MRRFFLSPEQIAQSRPRLIGQDARHIRNVLRLGPGDRLHLFDGTGRVFLAQIAEATSARVCVDLLEEVSLDTESPVELVIAQGFLKDKKMDGLVRPLTELGITRWVPFFAGRSVPAPDSKRLETRCDRWRKLSLEAVKQCGRQRPMDIDPPTDFNDALCNAEAYDLKLIFWENESKIDLSDLKYPGISNGVFAILGPEGGWEENEISAAKRQGFQTIGLGPRILKAETAALAAGALLQYIFGDMGRNCP